MSSSPTLPTHATLRFLPETEVSRGSEAGNRQKRRKTAANAPILVEKPLCGDPMSRFPPLPRPRDTSISLDTRSVAPMYRPGADGPRDIRREVDTAGFRVVLADPPWTFRSNSLAAPGRNPRRHYPCMTVDQLCQLPLAERVARDAVLFLCVPGPLLVIGAHLPLIKAWGFRPTAMGFVLVKLRPLADPTNFTIGRPSHWHRLHHQEERRVRGALQARQKPAA